MHDFHNLSLIKYGIEYPYIILQAGDGISMEDQEWSYNLSRKQQTNSKPNNLIPTIMKKSLWIKKCKQ